MLRLNDKEKTILLVKEILNLVENLNLNLSIFHEALNISQQFLGKKISKKFSTKIFAASILYVACKIKGHPIIFKEIASKLGLSRNEQKRAIEIYNQLIQKAKLSVKPSIKDYIERLVDALKLHERIKDLAIKYAEDFIHAKSMAGRSPISIAAAAVYLAAKKNKIHITQKDISVKAYISDVTLRKRIKELKEIIAQKERLHEVKVLKVSS